MLFHKGALLEDPKRVLVQQNKNVQSARQIRFTSLPPAESVRRRASEPSSRRRFGDLLLVEDQVVSLKPIVRIDGRMRIELRLRGIEPERQCTEPSHDGALLLGQRSRRDANRDVPLAPEQVNRSL